MSAPALIASDNRLLGWALSDVTLYGAQPGPAVTIGRAVDDPAVALAAPPAPAEAPAATPSDPQLLAPVLDEIGGNTDPGAVALAGSPPPHSFTIATPPANEPAVPAPTGSGTVSPVTVATPLQALAAEHGGTAADPLAIGEGHAAPVDPLAPTAAAPVIAPIEGAAEGPQALAAIVDPVAHAVDPLVTQAETVVTAPVDAVAPVIETVAAPITGVVVAAADTTLAGLGGSDPAAGIHTLVGMVNDAEAFDLAHVSPVEASPAPASLVDTLAADEAPASLLGDTAHDAGHALDDHHVHLGL